MPRRRTHTPNPRAHDLQETRREKSFSQLFEAIEDVALVLRVVDDHFGRGDADTEMIVRRMVTWREPTVQAPYEQLLEVRRAVDGTLLFRFVSNPDPQEASLELRHYLKDLKELREAEKSPFALHWTFKQTRGARGTFREQYLRDGVIVILWNGGIETSRILNLTKTVFDWPLKYSATPDEVALRVHIQILGRHLGRDLVRKGGRNRLSQRAKRPQVNIEGDLIPFLRGILPEAYPPRADSACDHASESSRRKEDGVTKRPPIVRRPSR